jgi:uncharacterized protein YbjT (DUF2867 family)
MARCLIVGCGCRGLALADELRAQGHSVRATSRRPRQLRVIADAGLEARAADPDLVGTVGAALDHVSLVYLLLGSPRGPRSKLEALHGPRLEALLERMLDTTVRGIVYEAAGDLDPELLVAGAARVRRACERSRIPYALLDVSPQDHGAWLAQAAAAAQRLLQRR